MTASKLATGRVSHGEEGVALFYALLVTLVVGGIIAITYAAALTETRQSAFELDFEDALHVAESGAEFGLQEVLTSKDITNASDPTLFVGTEEEWALSEALDPARLPTRIGEGEAVWLRPEAGATEFVYGVGFVPTREAFRSGFGEPYARVVRMEIAFTDARAPGLYAFLSDRILTFNGGGSSSVLGSNGSVHTNGSFNPPSASDFSFEGTVSFHECSAAACSDPGYAETDTVVPLNVGTPDEIYSTLTARNYVSGGGDWYDYCSGQWYQRTNPNGLPCIGGTAVSSVPGFSGTTATNTSSSTPAVYWFQGDVDLQLSSADRVMTVITEGDINLPTGNDSFNWTPAYEKLHAYAGGDVVWGNVDVNLGSISCSGSPPLTDAERAIAASIPPGIVYAGNDILMGGNPSAVQISFIADDDVVFNGGGNRCIVLETDATGDLAGTGVPIVVEWDELIGS